MKTDNRPMLEIIKEIVESVADGGGDEAGTGRSLANSVAMTAATECLYGTSGRGSPLAKSKIRAAADLGYLRITKRGRAHYIGMTERGLALLTSPPVRPTATSLRKSPVTLIGSGRINPAWSKAWDRGENV
jgi:hypothetical protein